MVPCWGFNSVHGSGKAKVRRAVNRGWTFEELRNAAEIADSDG